MFMIITIVVFFTFTLIGSSSFHIFSTTIVGKGLNSMKNHSENELNEPVFLLSEVLQHELVELNQWNKNCTIAEKETIGRRKLENFKILYEIKKEEQQERFEIEKEEYALKKTRTMSFAAVLSFFALAVGLSNFGKGTASVGEVLKKAFADFSEEWKSNNSWWFRGLVVGVFSLAGTFGATVLNPKV